MKVKKTPRKITDQEARNLSLYLAKCQSMYDFIEWSVMPTNLYMQNIKRYTKILVSELDHQSDQLMKRIPKENVPEDQKTWNDGHAEYLESAVTASQQADHLFMVCMKIEDLPKEDRDNCLNEINETFKKYGVE
jgi:hypothetical protein